MSHSDAFAADSTQPEWAIAPAMAIDGQEAAADGAADESDPFGSGPIAAAQPLPSIEAAFGDVALDPPSMPAAQPDLMSDETSGGTEVAAAAQPHSAAVAAPPVAAAAVAAHQPDADYLSRLERRLARLHTRPAAKHSTRRAAGSEFLPGSDTVGRTRDRSGGALSSWLDMDQPQLDPLPAVDAAVHSSDEEGEADDAAAADPNRLPAPAQTNPDHDESIGLLAAAAADAVDDSIQSASAQHDSLASQPYDPHPQASGSIGEPASSATSMQAMSVPAAALESSDGDPTQAPAAHSSHPMRTRLAYYASKACMERAAEWIEEQSNCAIM